MKEIEKERNTNGDVGDNRQAQRRSQAALILPCRDRKDNRAMAERLYEDPVIGTVRFIRSAKHPIICIRVLPERGVQVSYPFEDICDELSGKDENDSRGRYPKDFKFTGWHPHCRCTAISILKTDEEIKEDNRRILEGEDPLTPEESSNYIAAPDEGFEKWIAENSNRIDSQKTAPYFLSDNPQYSGVYARMGGVGSVNGTKLGRTATKEAYNDYKGSAPTTLSSAQAEQVMAIAKELGVKNCNPMTFFEANEGRANTGYYRGGSYRENCQCVIGNFVSANFGKVKSAVW